MDTLAERSKAVAQGAIPRGRGFETPQVSFVGMSNTSLRSIVSLSECWSQHRQFGRVV